MKNYQIIACDTAEVLEKTVNEFLKKTPNSFCLGGPVAIVAMPSPHTDAHKGWYQAIAEN